MAIRNYCFSAGLLCMALSVHSANAGEPEGGLAAGVSLYLNTQLAFSEAALCHSGSIVVDRVADARVKGASRDQINASFGPNLPPAMGKMIDDAFSYAKPGPSNSADYYQACSAAAIERMNAANKKEAFPESQ